MPTFLLTDRQNYRAKGDTVPFARRVKWWFAMTLGFPIRVIEEPTGNVVRISGRRIIHYVPVSQAAIDKAQKEAAEAQAQAQGGDGKRIIETPGMVIPRKRAH